LHHCKLIDSSCVLIKATSTEEEFFRVISIYDKQAVDAVQYQQEIFIPYSFEFGDPFSSRFVTSNGNESLPMTLQNMFGINEASNRGTTAAVVKLTYIHNINNNNINHHNDFTSTEFVLTAAHVAFKAFKDCIANFDYQEKVDVFNVKNLYCSYNMHNTSGYKLDYAFLRSHKDFEYGAYPIFSTNNNNNNNIDFGNVGDVSFVDILKILPKLASTGTYEVFKRGIATHDTFGILEEFSPQQQYCTVGEPFGAPKFSAPGDSGSLVFLKYPSQSHRNSRFTLYPIGVLHGGVGSKSVFIPLTSILNDLCEKHRIEEVIIEFLNPKLEGYLRFNKQIMLNFIY
jgi:hypothetical protein